MGEAKGLLVTSDPGRRLNSKWNKRSLQHRSLIPLRNRGAVTKTECTSAAGAEPGACCNTRGINQGQLSSGRQVCYSARDQEMEELVVGLH